MTGERETDAQNTVSLAERYANSDRFKLMFRDGMQLVEESASFLDGPGRDAVRGLSRQASIVYGAESMRLTTRLMQLASWLLLQRAANEGEMTREQLLDEKKKIRLENLPQSRPAPAWDNLPVEFVALVERSLALQTRIVSLDREIYGPGADENPVTQQINLLSTAFAAVKKG
jgi:regulator of CtrA degradation